jgi:hypothetical protein
MFHNNGIVLFNQKAEWLSIRARCHRLQHSRRSYWNCDYIINIITGTLKIET